MGVLVRELAALYAAFRAGGPSPLPELPVQYADYAAWQRERLRGRGAGARSSRTGGSSWRARRALLELPTDRPRPAVQTLPGRAACRSSSRAELPERLRALGRREGATLFMVLLAAFQALLRRYSGQEDVVVGTPDRRARRAAEIEGLIGFFVNTLVLRTDLSGDPTFRELLARVREATLGAYAHQDVPFEQLVEELQPEREPEPHAALPGDVRPAERRRRAALRAAGAGAASRVGAATGHRQVRPDADARGDAGGACAAALEYSTDLFDAATVERMLGAPARGAGGRSPPTRTCGSRELALLRRGGARARCWRSGTATERRVSGATGASTSCSRRRRRATPDARGRGLRGTSR